MCLTKYILSQDEKDRCGLVTTECCSCCVVQMPRDDRCMSQAAGHSVTSMDVSMPPMASPRAPQAQPLKEEPCPGTMIDTHRGVPIKQEVVSPQPVVPQAMAPLPASRPPAPEPQMGPTRQELNRTLGVESRSQFQQQGSPLYDLHERINNKLESVQIMVQTDQDALHKLHEVHQGT